MTSHQKGERAATQAARLRTRFGDHEKVSWAAGQMATWTDSVAAAETIERAETLDSLCDEVATLRARRTG